MTMNQHPEKLPRDLRDPNAMPEEPRRVEQTTRQTGEQLEPGAPRGRAPSGQIVDGGTKANPKK